MSKKKIHIITTGGTIAMASHSATEDIRLNDPSSQQENLAWLHPIADVEMESLFHLPSPHITLQEMYHLAQHIQQCMERPDIDGIVITHGTDTLEETAFFLHLVLPKTKPVIITGAMRSQNEPGSDGPFNLIRAVQVATHPEAANYGVLVVFQDEIHSAKAVTKKDTTRVNAFHSPRVGPVGHHTHKNHIDWIHYPPPSPTFPLALPKKEVLLIKAVAGMDDAIIQWALSQGFDGIVIEALGQGNLPPSILPGLQEALKQIPIVLVSRCYRGDVQASYNYPGGAKQLEKMGLIFARGLNGQKARIQLLLALAATTDRSQVEQYFFDGEN